MAKKTKKTKAVVVSKNKDRKLTLVPAPLQEKQLLFLLQRTPKEHIYQRKGKGGQVWDYVTGVYVKKVLNHVFGWMWDFEVKEHGTEGEMVWVLGKLTIKDKAGKPMIVKEQFGRADIKYKKDMAHEPKNMLDYGNDLKAATTDALKKCASELGFASDVYGKTEFKEIQKEDKGFVPPKTEAEEVIEMIEPQLDVEVILPAGKKVVELKGKLKGNTDEDKLADLKKRTGIILKSFSITEQHAGILLATLLNTGVK